MTAGRHTRPGDRSFAVSVLRHVAAAVALVAVVSAAFWAIGRVRPAARPTVEPAATIPPEASPTAPAASPPASPTAPPTTATPTIPTPTAPATPPPTPELDPATVTVQVLDAVLDDDGAAADRVADRLREAGYRVVAVNRAVRVYERTTVFYSPGAEAAAAQVAALLGSEQVAPKPDNLTAAVQVHVVVGIDARA